MLAGSRRAAVLAALFVRAGSLDVGAQEWTFVNLHPPGAFKSVALGVHAGQQSGYAMFLSEVGVRASVWTGTAASRIELGVGYCNGVNSGQQAGTTLEPNGGRHAGRWSGTPESWVDLHPAGATHSSAEGIDGAFIVGSTFGPNYDSSRAILWIGDAGGWVNLHPLGASYDSQATDVAGGEQVGSVSGTGEPGGSTHASLWRGTPDSWVDLHPAGSDYSYAYGVHGGQQVGFAKVGGHAHASLWFGTAESWVDLHPPQTFGSSAANATHAGEQVGWQGSAYRAALWSGTAASHIDLHALLPSGFTYSNAHDIWHDGAFTYIVGEAVSSETTFEQAVMWIRVQYTPGDTNCDSSIDFFDVDPFLEALFNPSGYATVHPNCVLLSADMNDDGLANSFDIDPFIAALFGQ